MNIEESAERVKKWCEFYRLREKTNTDFLFSIAEKDIPIEAIETLLTAYEREKEKNNELENDLKDMIKRYMEAESVKFWYNYIHKDKIRKMLQELEDRRNKQPVIGYWSKKAMLEKLLKEE